MLSIVIPTVKFNKTLDEAIESCFNLNIDYEIIVSINAFSYDEFNNSKFWNNSQINWQCLRTKKCDLYESLNKAISFAKKDWIFILSDDDLILPGFLDGFDLTKEDKLNLYATRTNIVDEKNNLITKCWYNYKKPLTKIEIIEKYFANEIHHHLSLLVFSKKLFKLTNGFLPTGSRNGYYVDSVFHLHAFANSKEISFSKNVVFVRREHPNQLSSRLFLGKEVNPLLKEVSIQMYSNIKASFYINNYFSNKDNLFQWLIKHRFLIEFDKLRSSINKNNFFDKLKFLFLSVFVWETNFKFKLKIISMHLRFFQALINKKI